MKRYFLDTEYGQIHYIVEGQSSHQSIVLLHKTPRSIDEYAEVIPLLAKNYFVIALDTLGYGDSDKPKKQPLVEDCAGIVLELMDAIGLTDANMVGHLTGSIIAIQLASAYPERVNKLVLSGPIYVDEDTRKRHSETAELQQWHVQNDGSHLRDLWQKKARTVSDPKLINRLVLDELRAGEFGEYAHCAVEQYHMEDRLSLVRAPVLRYYRQKGHLRLPAKISYV